MEKPSLARQGTFKGAPTPPGSARGSKPATPGTPGGAPPPMKRKGSMMKKEGLPGASPQLQRKGSLQHQGSTSNLKRQGTQKNLVGKGTVAKDKVAEKSAQQKKLKALTYIDLSTRAAVFRGKLLEEFRILDSGWDPAGENPPRYDTRDIILEPQTFKNNLREHPQELIKFKMFRRGNEVQVQQSQEVDKRLLRMRNIDKVPVGVWASWLVNSKPFNSAIMFFIFLNAILLGLQSELHEGAHWKAHIVLTLIDKFILVVFSVEILVKWLDSFWNFWTDSWNVFDFCITSFSAVPEILLLFSDTGALDASSVSRIAKQMRVFRTFRSLKMIVRFRSLRVIVRTILEAFQSIAMIMLLLVIIAYIYAIIGIYLLDEYTSAKQPDLKWQYKFRDLGSSMQSLFQLLTLDQWFKVQGEFGRVADPLITKLYFISWVCIGAFIFRNIFVGAMVKNFETINVELAKDDAAVQKKKQVDNVLEHIMLTNLAEQGANEAKEKEAANQGTEEVSANSASETIAECPKKSWFQENRVPTPPGDSEVRAGAGLVGDDESSVLSAPTLSDGKTPPVLRRRGSLTANDTRTRRLQQFSERANLSVVPETPIGPTSPTSGSPQQPTSSGGGGGGGGTNEANSAPPQPRRGSVAGFRRTSVSGEDKKTYFAAHEKKKTEYLWPKDTLFGYLQAMESLQENMKEYQELQYMASWALFELHDT